MAALLAPAFIRVLSRSAGKVRSGVGLILLAQLTAATKQLRFLLGLAGLLRVASLVSKGHWRKQFLGGLGSTYENSVREKLAKCGRNNGPRPLLNSCWIFVSLDVRIPGVLLVARMSRTVLAKNKVPPQYSLSTRVMASALYPETLPQSTHTLG